MTNQHLSDDQLDDVLAGDADLEVTRHLQSCKPCRAEIENLRDALAEFNAASLEWAEKQAPVAIPSRTRSIPRWQSISSVAAAAIVAAAFIFGSFQPKTTPVAHTEAVAQQDNVAEDNRLMAAIDSEIRWQAESPASLPASDRLLHKSAN